MKIIKNTSLFVILLLLPFLSFAKYIYPAIYVSKITNEKLNEKSGDELFLEIIEIDSKEQPSYYRIPEFPLYWKSSELKELKETKIWNGLLKEKEKITLFISLIEQDLPPWDPNDNIGTIKLELNNADGFRAVWSVSGDLNSKKFTSHKLDYERKVKLHNSDAQYTISFKMTGKDSFIKKRASKHSKKVTVA